MPTFHAALLLLQDPKILPRMGKVSTTAPPTYRSIRHAKALLRLGGRQPRYRQPNGRYGTRGPSPPGGAINRGTASPPVTTVPEDNPPPGGAVNNSTTDQPVATAPEYPPPPEGTVNRGTANPSVAMAPEDPNPPGGALNHGTAKLPAASAPKTPPHPHLGGLLSLGLGVLKAHLLVRPPSDPA